MNIIIIKGKDRIIAISEPIEEEEDPMIKSHVEVVEQDTRKTISNMEIKPTMDGNTTMGVSTLTHKTTCTLPRTTATRITTTMARRGSMEDLLNINSNTMW